MKFRNVLFGLILLLLILNVNSSPTNSTIRIHSTSLESYAIERCNPDGECQYYDSKDIIELDYRYDHIIKIIPQKHFEGINSNTFNRYFNPSVVLQVTGIVAFIFLMFWIINYWLPEKY